ncbi:cohesin domain-containing protein [Herbivorax sp. ANBcel31]|uniref:cohesin domain-containing protein n=1 Tax=Herbivorax sp. ANBcel31 TaxID=3069754 RepID=UPI0027AE5554|nr:cohesin domain-containing protein [Herbivorax sp. ANBcel31]MDQ2086159.1 cohesin domain-containing protein [Herbivorax sp. ANBcel31]
MYNKRLTLFLAGVLLVISLLSACGSDTEGETDVSDSVVTDSESGSSDQGSESKSDDTGEDEEKDSEKKLVADVDEDTVPVPNDPSTDNYIHLKLDKNEGEVGDIMKAEVKLDVAESVAGFQVNIKYDPEILKPVNYDTRESFEDSTKPPGATMVTSENYLPLNLADNDLENGFLNFGASYANLNDYKDDGEPENSGILGIIGFEILKKEATLIGFENSPAMPDGKNGTMLFDWDGRRFSNYEVVGIQKINY